MKKCYQSIMMAAFMIVLIVGCNMNATQSGVNSDETSGSVSRSTLSGAPGYDYGRVSISDNPVDYSYLLGEYQQWKADFIVPGDAGLRVQRGDSSSANAGDTVSEGIAYGMLLAYYFNDQVTFDGLWTYAKAHTVDGSLLMHWRVHPDGTNISEYSKPVTDNQNDHKAIYVLKTDFLDDLTGGIIPGDPGPGINYLNTWRYEGSLDTNYYYTKDEMVASGISQTQFVQIVQWQRTQSSAADADFDMAAALCFASETWTPSVHDYTVDAAQLIQDIIDLDFDTGESFIKNGNKWGGPECWNPSYFTPAWFHIYLDFLGKNVDKFTNPMAVWMTLNNVNSNMYSHMAMIDNANANGLYPDWCDTSDGTVKKADGSDRRYFFTADDVNNGNYVTLQSSNYYYDAIRTTWRLAVDYSWFGTWAGPVDDMIEEMAVAYNDPDTIVDGYSITGGPWASADRDGFNPGPGGVNNSMAFISMMACSKMVLNSPSENFYTKIINGYSDPDTDPYAYYPNTLRLLSLLYLSGYMSNPFVEEGSAPSNPVLIQKYQWTSVDLSRGYTWVLLDSSDNWGGWQVHHDNQGQFDVKIEAKSGTPSETTGLVWQKSVTACKLTKLVKITHLGGSDQIVVQCW